MTEGTGYIGNGLYRERVTGGTGYRGNGLQGGRVI